MAYAILANPLSRIAEPGPGPPLEASFFGMPAPGSSVLAHLEAKIAWLGLRPAVFAKGAVRLKMRIAGWIDD